MRFPNPALMSWDYAGDTDSRYSAWDPPMLIM